MITLSQHNHIAASQWDYERNGELTPDNIAGKSGKKAWFICSNNLKHKWEIKIYQRTHKKTGENIDCPYCGGRLAFPGETDFLTICPEAKEFWDYEKNDLDPTYLLPTSTKRAYYKCSRGHEFNRLIYNFTKSPKCSDCYLEDNNITVTHPNIVTMWDYVKNAPHIPEQFYKTSSKKVWWKCGKCGYSWESEIASRTASKGLCPQCEVNIVFQAGVNDIKTLHNELLKEWDYNKNIVDPSLVSQYDDRDFHWKCNECGYEWQTKIQNRIIHKNGKIRYTGCLACDGKVAIPGKTDLLTTHPILAREYIPRLNVDAVITVKAKSNKPRYWECSKCGEIFSAQPNSRTRYNDNKLHGCPYCAGKLPIKGVNDFKTIYPELAEEWDYDLNLLGPEDYTVHSNKLAYWKCKTNPNHKWVGQINTRSNGYSKCPECSRIKEGYSLADLHPELLKYWDYNLNSKGPEYYSEYSNELVYWKCNKNHSFKMEIYKYTISVFYCPICIGTKVIQGENDLATLYPEFLDIWSYSNNEKTPYEIPFSPTMDYFYECEEGHVWNNKIERAIETEFTCDYCSNRRLLPSFNSLKAVNPDIADEWHYEANDTTPDRILFNNTEYRRWKCNHCGMVFSATTKGRVEGTESCLYCNDIKATPGVNSFAALYPELLKDFSADNIFNPDLVFPDYSKRAIWECREYILQWVAPLRDVVSGNRECPYCSGQHAVPGKTSLNALYPDIAKDYYEGNALDCDYILPSYGEYVLWECHEYGKLYKARVREVVDGTAKCPYCSGRVAVPGKTSFKALYPELMKEWYYLGNVILANPDKIIPMTTQTLFWKCEKCGKPYKASPRQRVQNSIRNIESCPTCKGLRQNFVVY